MKTERYQFFAIVAVFTFGFFSHDLIHGTKNGDDIYYHDKPDSLQCTVNLDCDNHYDWSMFFPEGGGFTTYASVRNTREVEIP